MPGGRACRTPVVSAIGHEPDTPLVDHVADLRCSTPTEAGRRLVPDLAEETARIAGLRDRARRALGGWVDREHRLLVALRARPVLADPLRGMDLRAERCNGCASDLRGSWCAGWTGARSTWSTSRARLTALGPGRDAGPGLRDRAAGDRRRRVPVLRSVDECAPATGCASASPTARCPLWLSR